MRALKYLRQMPAVFTNKDLVRILGKGADWTKLSLNRWQKYGLVRPAGPRLGLYFNLVVAPNWQIHFGEAVRLAYPSAVVIGPSVLHQHGWITQIPRFLHLAVLEARTHPRMDGVATFDRPIDWYSAMAPFGEPIYGVPALTPENALKDARLYGQAQNMWVPTEDDLEGPCDADGDWMTFG